MKKKDLGLVYIGEERKNFTYGKYYRIDYIFPHFCIMDNCGANKKYVRNDIWFIKKFRIMEKKEYIVWSRAFKLKTLENA